MAVTKPTAGVGTTAKGLPLIYAQILPVMAIVSLFPVIPRLFAQFGGHPYAGLLVPMIVTAPSLCAALFAPLAGVIADRFGRRRAIPLLHKGELDLVLTPNIYSDPEYICEPLVTNELALVGWGENPALLRQPDLATVWSLPQAIVRFDRVRLASILSDEQLALYGGAGRTALVAPNFSCIPPSLIGTNIIAVLNRRLVNAAARDLPLAVWDVPISMPRMTDVMMFHPIRRDDGGLAWLRDQLRQAVTSIDVN